MINSPEKFNFKRVQRLPVLKSGKKKPKFEYLNVVTAFDIETTVITKYEQAIMWSWQFQICGVTVIGREWKQFQEFIEQLDASIPAGCRLVCYVHNLSYEWQFIKNLIPVTSVFAMDKRKILRLISDKIEFRCSYLHSNMSLRQFLKRMGVKDQKGELDYQKRRYPWTKLNRQELKYIINDVKGLVEAIETEMQRDGDTIYTIPLTSTGYARREAKAVLRSSQRWIKPLLPDKEVFLALRHAFRGGNTHANRHNAGVIHTATEEEPIHSYDISSSYPSVMITERFPQKFYPADPSMLWLYLKHDKALLIHLILHDVKLRNPLWGCPYISLSRCTRTRGEQLDNGRILLCQDAEMYITEVDFNIITSEYDFSYEIVELWQAQKKRLPKPFRELLMHQYIDKTQLKGIDDYLYQKTKNRFNSNYGMTVQNPVKPELIFKDGLIIEDPDAGFDKALEEYHKKGWLPYQWGVWVTAYARAKLEAGLQAIPAEAFLYCDTDSIKYIGNYDYVFDELNQRYLDEDLSAVDPEGRRHYLGIFEPDEQYKRFKTLGAKKYAYEDMEGNLHITVSGVSKIAGAKELKKLENFKEGFVFRHIDKLMTKYNDDPEPKRIRIQGHLIEITSNAALLPDTYTLGLSDDYEQLLRWLQTVDISDYI